MSLIFVYGTLKRGGSNHRQLAGQKFVGHACTVPGYRLFLLEGYPGMVPWPADQTGVVGEVWEVADSALPQLDAFEGVPEGLYRRERVLLQSPHQTADAYLYARSIEGRPDVGSEWPVT
ncbi:MAG: gamma-glutamylcyclotransferase [Verrucomicrobia bacterium]|nr:gamma-glutamylcyclotransferase [Verrucomicrobiota bacterium]